MKKYNDLSVKMKIPVILGIVSIAVFTLVCILLIIPLRRNTLEGSAQSARFAAQLAGETLAVQINASATVVTARANVISNLIESKLIPTEVKRQTLLDDMSSLVSSHATAVTNGWVILEPYAIDGMDSLFSNQPGNTGQGVVSAKWNSFGKLHTLDDEARYALYRQVKQTRQSMMSQPYENEIDGKKVLSISAIAPVIADDRFCGVVATDFDLAELSATINTLNVYGFGKLVTDKSIIAAHSDPTRNGTIAEHGNREILEKLPEGKIIEGFYFFEGSEVYKVYVPVQLATSARPWFFSIDVHAEDVYESSRKVAYLLMVYCFLGVILISIAGYFLFRPMLHSITTVTDIIHQFALGRINVNIDKNQSKDEIGTMKSELNRLLDGLKDTAGFAQNIGEGNLSAEYNLLSEDDVLGQSLLEMRQSLQKAEKEQMLRAKEEEHRNWGTAGLAKFAEILRRDNNDMEALSYNVISNLVKYLGINQGGIFVLNEAEREEERFLEMKACYAFDRKKFADKQIRAGEGLVGTCFLEGEPIYMTDIPNEYITITSGLGDANPSAIFICPLKVNDLIFGVIELASFHPFESHQLDFVQKVSESIAATISTVNVNIRTNLLLEQTKLQAEEMANTEEELRQNMEEMQATQEESRRRETELQEILVKMKETQALAEAKEHEMELFHNGIFAANNVVEFSPEGVITNVNQNLCDLFGLDRSVFVGAHMAKFNGEEVYQQIMSRLIKGELFENVNEINANGKIMTIRQKFIPITRRDGTLESAMLLGFHDQEEELRKKMEEIKEKNIEAANHEFELKQLQDLIFDSFNIVEISAEGVITEINQNVTKNFKTMTRKDLIGLHLANFCGKEETEKIMASAAKGKVYESIQNIPTGIDETTAFSQKFIPICNREGKLQRVILLAYPKNG